ncbi:MAG: metallophosphoesterase [Alicyclobacillaceae bacterium]|nr:metallophosphoesterase [Alicyclobacillaceae bacterium]
MKIFAIADLHLSFSTHKPMSVFGEPWEDHPHRVEIEWRNRVRDGDWVLIPGDISWGMRLEEAIADLEWIARLPGRKVLLRGNHDYWWPGITRLRRSLPPGLYALQNDSMDLGEGIALCGTRGWICPGSRDFTEHDERIYLREVHRLELSLQSSSGASQRWVMMHYPPVNEYHERNEMIDLMERYGVTRCIYGHLHGNGHRHALLGTRFGIRFHLVSCDYLRGRPEQLWPEEERDRRQPDGNP